MPDNSSGSGHAAGYAAAVQPIRAEAIHTDAKGLDVADIEIPVENGTIPGYRALPEKGGKFPVILVVQEIFGVHEHIKDICRRLAHLGYCAIAPALFVRQGDVSKMQDMREIQTKVVAKAPDAQVMSDLDAAALYTAYLGNADPGRLGITGFCWGGRIAWLYAAHNPALKAAVAWYGRLVGQTDELHPKHPLDVVGDLKCPVLGLYGALDESIPLDTVERVREAIRHSHKNAEIIVYPDAGHAFNADYRPTYRKDEAEDAWFRMRRWFETYV
jgi:carboxymethylenebutenolidase